MAIINGRDGAGHLIGELSAQAAAGDVCIHSLVPFVQHIEYRRCRLSVTDLEQVSFIFCLRNGTNGRTLRGLRPQFEAGPQPNHHARRLTLQFPLPV